MKYAILSIAGFLAIGFTSAGMAASSNYYCPSNISVTVINANYAITAFTPNTNTYKILPATGNSHQQQSTCVNGNHQLSFVSAQIDMSPSNPKQYNCNYEDHIDGSCTLYLTTSSKLNLIPGGGSWFDDAVCATGTNTDCPFTLAA